MNDYIDDHTRMVCVSKKVMKGEPVAIISYQADRVRRVPQYPDKIDTGFDLFHEGFEPWNAGLNDLAIICVNCLKREHPEIQAGMDAAMIHNTVVFLIDGEWVPEREL